MQWHPYRLGRSGRSGTAPHLGRVLEGEEVPCGYCNGTGKQVHMNSKCPVCRGKGFNKVKSPAVTCAYCGGSGFSEKSSHTTCPACRGITALRVQEPFEVCEACRGRGKVHGMNLPCMHCKGAGVAPVKAPSAAKRESKYPTVPPGAPIGPPPELFPEPEDEEELVEKRAPVKVMKDWGPGPFWSPLESSREDR